MARIIPTLGAMIEDGTIPILEGVWIDIYNHTSNKDVAGTICTKINHGSYWYVTEIATPGGDE